MNRVNIDTLPDSFDYSAIISNEILVNNLEIEFLYSSTFENAKLLRDFIEFISLSLNLRKKDIARIILVIDELNNNAIEYGTEKGGINTLRVIAVKNKQGNIDITIEVEDTGKGSNHKTALEMETLRAHQLRLGYGEHDSIRGRGLFLIIVKTVDRLYFRDTPTGGLLVGIKKEFLL